MSKTITGVSHMRSSNKVMQNNDIVIAWLWGELFFTFFIGFFLLVLGPAKTIGYWVIIIFLLLLVIGLKFLATEVD